MKQTVTVSGSLSQCNSENHIQTGSAVSEMSVDRRTDRLTDKISKNSLFDPSKILEALVNFFGGIFSVETRLVSDFIICKYCYVID